MSFAAALTSMHAALFREFGVAGLYQPAAAEPTELRLILVRHVATVGDWSCVAELRTQVQWLRTDVPAPASGDTLVVDGVVWTAVDVTPNSLAVSLVRPDGSIWYSATLAPGSNVATPVRPQAGKVMVLA